MKFIKDNYKYFLIFVLFLFLYVCFFYENCSFDVIWNYGFSHAIRRGEIPYLDFNLISTPLYSFLMSLFLFIKDDIFMYLIGQSLLVSILFYILFKQFGAKSYLVLPLLSFPLFLQFNATYNFLAYFLIVLLFLLEKQKRSDYLLGFVMGLLIITKQTIGIPLLFLSFLALRDRKIILRRFLFAMIPCLFLFIYLLLTGSLKSFIDLCFLGLWDFGTKNHSGSINFLVIFSMILFFYLIYVTIKDNKNILKYYALGSFAFSIPMFDFYHLGLFLGVVVLLYLDKIKLKDNYLRNMSLIIFIIICLFNFVLIPDKYQNFTFLNKEHFRFYALKEEEKEKILGVIKKYKKYENSYILDESAMFYTIASNKKVTYFDCSLKGNYGYDGSNKMIEKIKKMHDVYFFIDNNKGKDYSEQLDGKIIKYVIKNSLKKDEIFNFDIYYKE